MLNKLSYQIIKYAIRELDKGNKCEGIFLDLVKGFDLVDHEIMLKKK